MKHGIALFFIVTTLSAQELQHECGLAFLRLLKPISYYHQVYNDAAWGIHKLCMLIEKQRNRGQDSVGIAVMQCDMPPGQPSMMRMRSVDKHAFEDLFSSIEKKLQEIPPLAADANDLALKQQSNLIGEVYLGHVRYATYAGCDLEFCQPCLCKNNIPAKAVALAGNFNMTNSSEIMQDNLSYGLVPFSTSDTYLIMSIISYWINKTYDDALAQSLHSHRSLSVASRVISEHLDLAYAIQQAAARWDGGYVFGGILGTGDGFVLRDPAGIRPGFYYHNDELFAVASERTALMSVFNASPTDIKEIPPAHVIIIRKNGTIEQHMFTTPLAPRSCTFERIYFSRPNDPDINKERKTLGKELTKRVLEELSYDLRNVIFSYIPNTSEIAFRGLIEELNEHILRYYFSRCTQDGITNFDQLIAPKARAEKLIFKDQIIRTFIANDSIRKHLVGSVYDVAKGMVSSEDTLVVLDDSIVRGTTLRESIMKQLIRLNPKRIIILSAAPLLLYPDCYGIDMSQIGHLIGFQAAVALTKERGNQRLLDEIYHECCELQKSAHNSDQNPVKKLYDQFTQQEIEEKIAQLVYPHDSNWKNKLVVIYQTIDGLHRAVPHHSGDWYFTGNYPTPGGFKVLMTSYINWYTARTTRAY